MASRISTCFPFTREYAGPRPWQISCITTVAMKPAAETFGVWLDGISRLEIGRITLFTRASMKFLKKNFPFLRFMLLLTMPAKGVREVVSMVRVSTPGQAADDKLGLKRQQDDIDLFCDLYRLKVIRKFPMVISGTDVQRTKPFREMLEMLKLPNV